MLVDLHHSSSSSCGCSGCLTAFDCCSDILRDLSGNPCSGLGSCAVAIFARILSPLRLPIPPCSRGSNPRPGQGFSNQPLLFGCILVARGCNQVSPARHRSTLHQPLQVDASAMDVALGYCKALVPRPLLDGRCLVALAGQLGDPGMPKRVDHPFLPHGFT